MKENFKIVIDPSKYDGIAGDKLNYFADLVEIIATISKAEVTVGEILDRFYECKLLKKGEAQINDSNEAWVKEIFQLIKLRSDTYNEKYPFYFDFSKQFICLKSELSNCNKLYIQLLLSANLPFFSDFQEILSTDFENLSYYSLLGYFNKSACIKKFGKRSEYTGRNTKDKIIQLAADINIEFDPDSIEQINKYNTNEKGLDLIAWFPFGDRWGNLLVILGQCTCINENWHLKRQDTVPYEHFFIFKGIKPVHALFIPHSLTKEKLFFNAINISDTLLFERKRLIDYFLEGNYGQLESNNLIELIIDYKEDIA